MRIFTGMEGCAAGTAHHQGRCDAGYCDGFAGLLTLPQLLLQIAYLRLAFGTGEKTKKSEEPREGLLT